MGNIKEIKVGGVCTCCSTPKELKELILNPAGQYIRVTIGSEQIEVSPTALIRAIEAVIA